MGRQVRRVLDGLYLAGGVLSALSLITIVILIVMQVASRWFGFPFRGGSDYAGYAMASASFFGFAYALNHGAHIRVSLLINNLGKWRKWGEIWCYGIGATISTYFAWHACKFTWQSRKFNDISSGLDATPLWIPQAAMAMGSVLLALVFWDNLVALITSGRSNVTSEQVEEHA